MSILEYSHKALKNYKVIEPRAEAAIIDFIMGECSCRQAAEVVGCSQQGIYILAVNALRKWEHDGEIDLKGVTTRIFTQLH